MHCARSALTGTGQTRRPSAGSRPADGTASGRWDASGSLTAERAAGATGPAADADAAGDPPRPARASPAVATSAPARPILTLRPRPWPRPRRPPGRGEKNWCMDPPVGPPGSPQDWYGLPGKYAETWCRVPQPHVSASYTSSRELGYIRAEMTADVPSAVLRRATHARPPA